MAQPEFKIESKVLIVDIESTDLDAYRWNAPGKVPVFFIFISNEVHIITLDDDEKPFTTVKTNNQEKKVKIVTDEEVVMYAEEADRVLALKKTDSAA